MRRREYDGDGMRERKLIQRLWMLTGCHHVAVWRIRCGETDGAGGPLWPGAYLGIDVVPMNAASACHDVRVSATISRCGRRSTTRVNGVQPLYLSYSTRSHLAREASPIRTLRLVSLNLLRVNIDIMQSNPAA